MIQNLKGRFLSESSAYHICKLLGGFFFFFDFFFPSVITVVDIENLSPSLFYELIKQIHFVPAQEHELKQLFFENKLLWRFACKLAEEARLNTHPNAFNITYLKQFVLNNKEKCPVMYIFVIY